MVLEDVVANEDLLWSVGGNVELDIDDDDCPLSGDEADVEHDKFSDL